jgi:pyridoxine kinase
VPGRSDLLATVTATETTCTSIEVPRLPVRPAGTGDLLAGLTVARLALGVKLEDAVARAVAGVSAALSRTSAEPWAEMPIASTLGSILRPGEAEALEDLAHGLVELRLPRIAAPP